MDKIITDQQIKAIGELFFQANVPVKTYDLLMQIIEKLPVIEEDVKSPKPQK